MGTLFSPVLGAVGVILLRDIISNFTESWTFIMGLLFMATVLGFRSGLIGILGKMYNIDQDDVFCKEMASDGPF